VIGAFQLIAFFKLHLVADEEHAETINRPICREDCPYLFEAGCILGDLYRLPD